VQGTLDIGVLAGPSLVTAGYFALWYFLLIGLQRRTKYRLQREYAAQGRAFDRYFGQDEQMLAVDRVVINTQEQMVPFVLALWLQAVFVSATAATWLGAAYVVLRSCYPLLMGRRVSKMQPRRVYLVTVPSYWIILIMMGSVVVAAIRSLAS
jgi:hypothetical protein